MRLDPAHIAALATDLRAAAQEVLDVSQADVPRLFRRNRTIDQLGERLVSAAGSSSAVARELELLGPQFAGPAGIADSLAGAAGTATYRELQARPAGLLKLRDGAFHARAAADLLDHVATGLATTDGSLVSMLRDATGRPPQHASWIDATGTLAQLVPERFGDRAPFAAGIGWRQSHPIGRAAQALQEPFDAGAAFAGLLDHATREAVPVADLRAAFDVAASHAGIDAAQRTPTWLEAASTGGPVRLDRLQRHDLLLRATVRDRSAMVDMLLDRLANPTTVDDVVFARAARDLPDDVAVALPRAPGRPSLDDIVGTSGTGSLTAEEQTALRDGWVLLARESDDRVLRALAHLETLHPSAEVVQRRALLAAGRPELVFGEAAARSPHAAALLERGADPGLSGRAARDLADAWDFFRSADGDRTRMLDAWEAIAAPDSTATYRQQLAAAHAFLELPESLRPTGWQHLRREALDVTGASLDEDRDAMPRLLRRIAATVHADRLQDAGEDVRAAAAAAYDTMLAEGSRRGGRIDADRLATLHLALDAPAADSDVTARLLLVVGHPPSDYLRSIVDELAMARDAARMSADPATDVQAVAAETRRLLALDVDQLDEDAVRRLHVLTSMTGDAAPVEPPLGRTGQGTIARLATRRDQTLTIERMRDMLELERDSLRQAFDRRELVRSGVGRDDTRAELRALLAHRDEELTPSQLRRIAVLDGLPDALRPVEPYLPARATFARTWRANAGVDNAEVAGQLRLLRTTIEAGDEAARTGATRDDHLRELADLLFRPEPLQLDEHELRRVALLTSMPPEVRPPLPTPTWATASSLTTSALDGTLSRSSWSASTARRELLAHLDDPVERIVATIKAGDGPVRIDDIDPVLAPMLYQASDDQLAAHGIDRLRLLREALEPTRGSGKQEAVAWATRRAWDVLAGLDETTLDPASQTLVAELRTLLRRNADRAAGTLDDGYARHPDYAEHGRAIETAALLERISRPVEPAATSAPTPATAETLSW